MANYKPDTTKAANNKNPIQAQNQTNQHNKQKLVVTPFN